MSRPVQGGLSVAALVAIPLLAVLGSESFRAALDFTTGVLSLVSLTASVAWGLTATDRLLLSTRHRLLAQGIHRATAVASLGFLLLHATVKVSLGHVEAIGAFVPFGLGVTGTGGLIGLGSLAGLLMVVAAATGALRSTLAGRSRFAARWRPLHMLAYPAWCFALMHGLYTGRPAATWVVTLYCLALAVVAGAVSLRLLPAPTRRALVDRLVVLISLLEGRRPTPEPSARRARRTEREAPSPPEEPPTLSAEWLDRPVSAPFLNNSAAPPVPQLYEAVSAPPVVAPASPVPPAGAGFSAAYRAVSRATTAAPETASYPTDPGVPYAERIPMTEELPVVPDPSPRPGYWPAPSPPMPTYSSPPPAGEPWNAPAGERP
ncbi:hypothetical protein [Streptomyces sp. NBC_01216]|uniref:hypothetical protein n=1 Tax=unclassified Streptomyces TaxID=2593676 RepID=UPI002E15EBCA|nr:hypothetical protein OG393_22180 [Streptomyces sp. NBC_01216]